MGRIRRRKSTNKQKRRRKYNKSFKLKGKKSKRRYKKSRKHKSRRRSHKLLYGGGSTCGHCADKGVVRYWSNCYSATGEYHPYSGGRIYECDHCGDQETVDNLTCIKRN